MLVMMSVSKRYIAAAPSPPAEFCNITQGLGKFAKGWPIASDLGKSGPLFVLLDDLQVVNAHQGGHRLVPAGNYKTFTAMGSPGNKFREMTLGMGDRNLWHKRTSYKSKTL